MPVPWADVLKGVKSRQWTIHEAWALIESSASEMGLHPDVHVVFPENGFDRHFITKKDHKGVEYRDRKQGLPKSKKGPPHSVFRNAWEAAGAVCVGLNSEAGEEALKRVTSGDVTIRSRSALLGSSKQFVRLWLGDEKKETGVSYFEQKYEFAVLLLVYRKGNLGVKTVYPSTGGSKVPPIGKDAVEHQGQSYYYSVRA